MNSAFPRILTLLRKERGISQKKAATDLGVSQALLSHYEKGIRECGLDFVVRSADYYHVSCDYLLGRTPDKTGAVIAVNEIPDNDPSAKENQFRGSVLPVLNKKLIVNSLNILFDLLQRCNNKGLTTEISAYLTLAVYAVFRELYAANPKNPAAMFSVDAYIYPAWGNKANPWPGSATWLRATRSAKPRDWIRNGCRKSSRTISPGSIPSSLLLCSTCCAMRKDI